jgi:LysM repeat protein
MAHVTFESDDDFAAVCPYLGLADDADSHATYATEAHRCYRLPNPTRIATGHQESYCLGASHVSCPVYLGEGVPGAAAPAAAAAASAMPPPRMPPRGPAPSTVRGPDPRDAGPTPRQRAGSAQQNGQQTQRPLRRPQNAGTIGPRPRAGGVSMPVATVGLFALAIVVIVLAFAIQHLAGDGGTNLTAAETFATTQAQKATANAGSGTQTQPAATTTATNGTPGATTAANKTPGATTPAGTAAPGGQKTYVVKSGDICSTIAAANGITLQQLEDANGLTDDSCTRLQVGQTLKLP